MSASATRPAAGRRLAIGLEREQLAFAGLLAFGALVIVFYTRGFSFFADEWDFILDRRGLSAHVLLTPHGPHLNLAPILIYKLLLGVFGAGSYVPFRLLTALDMVIVAGTVGVITRRAWGGWWGLAPVLLVICLGLGGGSTLSPFQVGYTLAIAGGLGALIALNTPGRGADVLACLSLLVSLASGSQGVCFLVGGAALLVLRGEWRHRIWAVLVPAVLYALWYKAYGEKVSQTDLSLWTGSLRYMVDSLSTVVGAVAGLSTISTQTGLLDPAPGLPLAWAALIALAVAVGRGWRGSPLFWGVTLTLALLWFVTSLSNLPTVPRPFNDPRYLSSNAALLAVVVCLAVPQPRAGRGLALAALVAVLAVAVTNFAQYAPIHRQLFAAESTGRAEIGAMMVMRGVVPANFDPSYVGDPGVLTAVQAGPLFRATDAFGMIYDSVAQIRQANESAREVVDGILQRGELTYLAASPGQLVSGAAPPPVVSGATRAHGNCRLLSAGPALLRMAPGRYELVAGGHRGLEAALARFSSRYANFLTPLRPGQAHVLTVPRDRATGIAWLISTTGPGGRVCALAG